VVGIGDKSLPLTFMNIDRKCLSRDFPLSTRDSVKDTQYFNGEILCRIETRLPARCILAINFSALAPKNRKLFETLPVSCYRVRWFIAFRKNRLCPAASRPPSVGDNSNRHACWGHLTDPTAGKLRLRRIHVLQLTLWCLLVLLVFFVKMSFLFALHPLIICLLQSKKAGSQIQLIVIPILALSPAPSSNIHIRVCC